jgi:hypothetical protein
MTAGIHRLKRLKTAYIYSESNTCASWAVSCLLKVVRPVRGDSFVSPWAILIDSVNRADKSDSGKLTPLNPCITVPLLFHPGIVLRYV